MMQFMRLVCAPVVAALMTACGGGGGSPGNTGGNGGGVAPAAPTLAVSLIDASGAEVTGIAVGGSFAAKAVLKDATGLPIANRLVTFAVSNTALANVSPDTDLTDAAGVATVTIAPASVTVLGAATLSATADVSGAVTGQEDFSVSSSNLTLSEITLGSANLPSGGNTSLNVTAMVGGSPATGTPVNVVFSASCGRINGAGASFSTTTNGSGMAAVVYTSVESNGTLCSGPVTLTASSAGATPRTASVSVAPPVANAITFVSATPQQIFVAGSGALEQTVVKFKALAGSTALPNVSVRMSLQVNPGGVGLNASGSPADVTLMTDSSGEVALPVFSGTIPGPVKIRAELVSAPSVFAESQNLSVSSGPPSQRFMSLSVSTYNIEGGQIDGTPTTLIARLADRQGNPVEDGTVVNFTAEGGQVASSCATVKADGISACSVDFMSQNHRPEDGRVSVLAFASGTKDYVDVNGNNRYDAAVDTLVQIGEAYRDDDENNSFAAGEFVVPRGGTAACAGTGGPFPSRANTCDNSLATTVRQQAVILFSSSEPWVEVVDNSPVFFSFMLASLHNRLLPMPAGSTVAVEVGDRTPDNEKTCTMEKLFGTVVPNTFLATKHEVTLKDCASGDLVSIKVKVPSGRETPSNFPIQ